MSTTTPGRGSVPAQAQPPQAARTIDLDAPAPAPAPAGLERTRTDTVRDAVHVGACCLAGVLISTGFALEVADTDTDSGTQLIAAVAKDPDRFFLSNALASFGLVLVAAVGLAVMRLVRGRGRVLGTVGGLLAMVGGTAAAAGIFMYGSVVSVMADSGQDPATMGALQDDFADTVQTGLPFFIGFPGMTLGLAVCAAALLVSHAVARWVPIAMLAGLVIVMALGDEAVSSVGDLLLTASFIGIGVSLWQARRRSV